MSAKINGKTLGQHVSKLNKKVTWLKRLNRVLKPFTSNLGKLFDLPASNLTPKQHNVITFRYIGDAVTADAFTKHVRKLENAFDVRFNADNTATFSQGKVSILFKLESSFTVTPTDDPVLPVENILPMPAKLAKLSTVSD